jgi:hypothetical protein
MTKEWEGYLNDKKKKSLYRLYFLFWGFYYLFIIFSPKLRAKRQPIVLVSP